MPLHKESQKELNQNLWSSIYDGDFQSSRELIKDGAKVNFNGGELLIQNIMKNNFESVNFLISNKVSFNTTHQKCTPIKTAIYFADMKMVELLINNGANVQENNNDPIKHAAYKHDFELFKYLHKKGASLNNEFDIILKDASKQSLEMLVYCFDNGAIVQNKAHFVNHVTEMGKTECLDYIIKQGFSLNEKEHDGEYPLYVAAISGQADKIDLLVANGVEPNDKKALLGAVNNGHLDAVKTLVNHGAATDHSTLYQATIWGQPEIVDFLLIEKKIPITEETRIWLNEQKGVSKDVAYTALLLEKRDLNEKLETKLQPKIQKKQMTMKL